MKKIYLVLFTALFSLFVRGQANTANYVFATNTISSLVDMSSGTTTLIAPDQDDAVSAVTNIGFEFFLNGGRYAQFSVNSNGTLRLGATVIGTTLYDPLGQASQALITSYGADQRTHTTGKVHYKVTGTAPNRVLVVEWLNMQSYYNAGGTADLTYQLLLRETTGSIQSIYGSMNMGISGSTADANSTSPQYGFSSGNAVGTVGSVTAAQSGTPTPTFSGTAATPVNNAYTVGPITVLTSASNLVRRSFSYTPPAVSAAPTGLSFSNVSATAMTLNWTDNASNEVGYAIYRSTDGVNYDYVTTAPANSTSFVQTSLAEGTAYYWRVYAITEGAVSNAAAGMQLTSSATPVNSATSGLWSDPATWMGGVVPDINSDVTINTGHTVTIDVDASAYRVLVGRGIGAINGVLQFENTTARTLTVFENLTIYTTGTLQSGVAGTQTGHNLILNGVLNNAGTLDFSTAGDLAGASITFTGNSDANFTSGGSAVTDIRQIVINKSTPATTVELNLSALTVRGTNTDVVTGGFLTLTSGIFKISGNSTYTGRMFPTAAYTIPATAGVWLNNPNFTIAAQNGNLTNNGLFRISAGTWNVGTLSTAALLGGATGRFVIEGGTVNNAGRFSPASAVSYTQTGGTVNIAVVGNAGTGTTQASFYLATNSIFDFTGGVINLITPCTGTTPNDWNVIPAITTFGGTLNLGTGATPAGANFRLRANLPNFVIDNTTNPKTATAIAQVNLNGTTNITAGSTLVINGFVCLILGPTFTNNGTLTGTAVSTRFYFLGGSGATTYTGSGVVTAPLTSFEIDNVAGVVIDPASPQITTLRFNNFAGGLINSSKLTIGNGAATTAIVQLGVAGPTNPVYGFDVPPVFNPGTGGVNLLYAPEIGPRTSGNEMPPSRLLNLLSISNTNPVTISGGNVTTSGLTMSGGNIITAGNVLTLGTAAATPGTYTYTSGIIVGKFKRWINNVTGNNDFPVGISIAKRNASINFTTAPTTGGTLTTEWIGNPAGINGLPLTEGALNVTTTSNDGYWSVVAGDGLTGGTYTGTFTATGIAGVTNVSKLVLVKRTDVNAPWTLEGTHVTTSGTTAAPILQRTGLTSFSEFGIGSDDFIVLPVTLLNLTGRKLGRSNQLQWATASEQDNRGFEVLISSDGASFVSKGFVSSQAVNGTSSVRLNYSFTDANPTGAVQQYRLRQVDANGRNKYSNIIVMKSEQAATLSIAGVFPNPAVNVINLQVSVKVKDNMSIVVTDINGRKIMVQQANIEAGSTNIPVTVSNLPVGTYTVRLLSSDGKEQSAAARFVKQ